MVNANFVYSPLAFIPINNIYPDLNADWYGDIGWTITQSMIIMAGLPVCFLGGFWWMKVCYRWLDAGFFCCTKQIDRKTKTTTQKQYKDLWSGFGYVMYSQYSSVAVQIFVSSIYGIMCPVLYPITFFSLVTMYTMERLNLAYWHPRPPMYGKDMNK